jgi:hypothetical protein
MNCNEMLCRACVREGANALFQSGPTGKMSLLLTLQGATMMDVLPS